MKIIKLKSKDECVREIILESLLPLRYIFNNTDELKIYYFSILPSLEITIDRYKYGKEIEVKIIWLMGGITFLKILKTSPFYFDD